MTDSEQTSEHELWVHEQQLTPSWWERVKRVTGRSKRGREIVRTWGQTKYLLIYLGRKDECSLKRRSRTLSFVESVWMKSSCRGLL